MVKNLKQKCHVFLGAFIWNHLVVKKEGGPARYDHDYRFSGFFLNLRFNPVIKLIKANLNYLFFNTKLFCIIVAFVRVFHLFSLIQGLVWSTATYSEFDSQTKSSKLFLEIFHNLVIVKMTYLLVPLIQLASIQTICITF